MLSNPVFVNTGGEAATPTSPASTSRSTMSTPSEDPFAPFVSLLARIKSQSIITLAIRLRQQWSRSLPVGRLEEEGETTCALVSPPNCGSFNLAYTLEFSDGAKWVLRIPCAGHDGFFTAKNNRPLRSEAMTMRLIRQSTSIPIPEVISFDETTNNEICAPFIMMQFVEGSPVSEKWFESTGPTPLQERRLRILDTIASAMSQLRDLKFHKIGSLQFCGNHDTTHSAPPSIGPCNLVDMVADLQQLDAAADAGPNFKQIGPFDSSREYLNALLDGQAVPRDGFSKGVHKLLGMMIRCLPSSESASESSYELFELSHPDFDSQNFLVSEDGTLTSIIDWDNVHTVPDWIGCRRYPGWITRDWDPFMYAYGSPDSLENSPEELDSYRQWYAGKMRSLIPLGNADLTLKSHLFEAIWLAASDPLCIDQIVQKIFLHMFPAENENNESTPLYLYETAVALADDCLEKQAEERIMKELKVLFSVSGR